MSGQLFTLLYLCGGVITLFIMVRVGAVDPNNEYAMPAVLPVLLWPMFAIAAVCFVLCMLPDMLAEWFKP